jgi:hypothetical protein
MNQKELRMDRHRLAGLLVVFSVFSGMVQAEQTVEQMRDEADKSIMLAEAAVEQARVAIEDGKQLVAQIPADSAVIYEVKEMLVAASENWAVAVNALKGSKESASKITSASSLEVAQDYKLLASVNSKVALSGAKVVQTGLIFVDAAASNKSEALDVIRIAMQDSLAAASQVQFNYERVKALILEKYSK